MTPRIVIDVNGDGEFVLTLKHVPPFHFVARGESLNEALQRLSVQVAMVPELGQVVTDAIVTARESEQTWD